jgi:hypothetical protein
MVTSTIRRSHFPKPQDPRTPGPAVSPPSRGLTATGHPHRVASLNCTDALVDGRRETAHADLEQIARVHIDMLSKRVHRSDKRVALDDTLLAGLQVAYRKTKLGHIRSLRVRC